MKNWEQVTLGLAGLREEDMTQEEWGQCLDTIRGIDAARQEAAMAKEGQDGEVLARIKMIEDAICRLDADTAAYGARLAGSSHVRDGRLYSPLTGFLDMSAFRMENDTADPWVSAMYHIKDECTAVLIEHPVNNFDGKMSVLNSWTDGYCVEHLPTWECPDGICGPGCIAADAMHAADGEREAGTARYMAKLWLLSGAVGAYVAQDGDRKPFEAFLDMEGLRYGTDIATPEIDGLLDAMDAPETVVLVRHYVDGTNQFEAGKTAPELDSWVEHFRVPRVSMLPEGYGIASKEYGRLV